VAAALTVLAPSAFAAGEGKAKKKAAPRAKKPLEQVTGAIVSISADTVTLKTEEGTEVKLIIIPGTTLGSKDAPKSPEDFKSGDKVVVRYKDDGTNKVARSISTPGAPGKGKGKGRKG
jgi:hypothetical protein